MRHCNMENEGSSARWSPRLVGLFPLLVVLEAGCLRAPASRSTASPPTSVATVDDHPPGRSDCPWVADGCPDDDGCSDRRDARPPVTVSELPAAIRATCQDASPDPLLLAEVARELRDKPALTKVRVLCPNTDCGSAVRDELERRAPARVRIETVTDPGARFVEFEIAEWNGVACRSP